MVLELKMGPWDPSFSSQDLKQTFPPFYMHKCLYVWKLNVRICELKVHSCELIVFSGVSQESKISFQLAFHPCELQLFIVI